MMFVNDFLSHLSWTPVPPITQEHTRYILFFLNINILFSFCLLPKQFQLLIPQISEQLWWPVGTYSSLRCLLSATVWFPSEGNKLNRLDFLHYMQSVRFTSCIEDTAPAVWSSVSPPHLPGRGSDNIAQRTSYWYPSWWASAHSQREIIGWGSIHLMETICQNVLKNITAIPAGLGKEK